MIEPGSWIRVRPNGVEERGRYFEFPREREADLHGAAAIDALDSALKSAIKRQIVSNVPVGSFLSGGIDSPLITAAMAGTLGHDFPAFTIGTETLRDRRVEDASRYAAEIGVDHVTRHVTADDALELVPHAVRACGEPFADYSILPTMLVSRIASERVKVALSGDGGDELFLGYAGRFSAVLRVAEQFAQPQWLRTARWGAKKYLGRGTATYDIRRASIGDWYRSRHTRIPESTLGRLFPTLGSWPREMTAYDYVGSEVESDRPVAPPE